MKNLKKVATSAVAGLALVGGAMSNKTSADGFAAGWSDWSTWQSNVANEKSKEQWHSSYVNSWSACDSSYKNDPGNRWKIQGKYDPHNCPRDCGWSYSYDCGESYSYSCPYKYSYTGYKKESYTGLCYRPHPVYGRTISYSCTKYKQAETTKYAMKDKTCTGWNDKTCWGWQDKTCWDASCGDTETCYQVPTGWNAWSEWYDTSSNAKPDESGSDAHKFKLETQTVFSFPGRLDTPTVAVSPEGIVTWTAVANANKYQISIDNSNWIDASSGYNFKSTIVAQAGQRTVYVRAMDSNNVLLTSYSGSYTVNVYTVTFDSKGGSAVNPINVISGGTVTLPGGPTLRGYTFKQWVKK